MAGAVLMPARRSDPGKPATIKIAPDAIVILRKISGITGEFMETIVSDLVRKHGTARYRELVREESRRLESKPNKSE